MPTRAAYEISHRVARQFGRHFQRHARDVLVYGDPNKLDCTCASVGPLGSAVDANCESCSGKGYIVQDSSTCLCAIVVSAEPRRSIMYGGLQHVPSASYHDGAFIVVFQINDVIFDPVRFPDQVFFEKTGNPRIGWGSKRFTVKSYARDGIGAEDNYLKVFVEETEE